MLSVDVSSIKDIKGATLDITRDVDSKCLDVGLENTDFIGPVTVDVTVTNAGSHFVVDGSVAATLTSPCSRCLVQTGYRVSSPLFERFRRGDFSGGETEDEEPLASNGDNIDLSELIRDALIMVTPMKVLCNEKCLGLCQTCGCNLNSDKCECTVELDSRLSVLAQLLKPKENED